MRRYHLLLMRFVVVLVTLSMLLGALFNASALTCANGVMSKASTVSFEAQPSSDHSGHHTAHMTAAQDPMPCHDTQPDQPPMDGSDCCCSLMAQAAVIIEPRLTVSTVAPGRTVVMSDQAFLDYEPGLEKPPPRA